MIDNRLDVFYHNRLADSGMGALEYKPGIPYDIPISLEDLVILAVAAMGSLVWKF